MRWKDTLMRLNTFLATTLLAILVLPMPVLAGQVRGQETNRRLPIKALQLFGMTWGNNTFITPEDTEGQFYFHSVFSVVSPYLSLTP